MVDSDIEGSLLWQTQTLKGVLCGRLSYLRESCVADSDIEGSLVW